MKKILIIAIVIALLFLFIWVGLGYFIYGDSLVTSYKCSWRGGRVVNDLAGEGCLENETNIGEIKGMRCPCICCVPG